MSSSRKFSVVELGFRFNLQLLTTFYVLFDSMAYVETDFLLWFLRGVIHFYLSSVTCILRWASCKQSPTCPQCKNPFDFLSVHRALDGR